jgi:hypothetical protein
VEFDFFELWWQAAGYVLTVAMKSPTECSCGWLRPAVLSLLVLWIFCLPLGLILYLAIRLPRSVSAREIRFKRPKDAGSTSWAEYLRGIVNAQADPQRFAQPAVLHTLVRTVLGACGAVCIVLCLRATTAREAVPAAVLFVAGFVLCFSSSRMAGKWGRTAVVVITNHFASQLGVRFVMDAETGEVTRELLSQKGGKGGWLLHFMAWIQVWAVKSLRVQAKDFPRITHCNNGRLLPLGHG